MGLFDQSQGLMGLGQSQQVQSPMGGLANRPPSQAQIAEQQRANAMSSQFNAMTPEQKMSNFMGNLPQGQPRDSFSMGMPQYDVGYTRHDFNDPKNLASYQPPQQDTYGFDATGNYVGANMPTGGFNPFGNRIDTPMQPNYMGQQGAMGMPQQVQSPMGGLANRPPSQAQIAEQQKANAMTSQFNAMTPEQQMSNFMGQQPQGQPVNTQSVQPNFMGQAPFGQPQSGQFTSTNPFVQAAQANAQGNIAGALQATAANRINQQTPYGSLSYQQTGTDAQGNPIWSANQQLSPELQQLTQSSLAGLQASQATPMYGINPGDTYSNAIMQRLAPQQSQAREALDAQLANQGIMPGSEAYNRAKTLLGQTQNDALTSAIVGGMNTGIQAQNLQNTTAANIRNLATPGYVNPYNQAAVAGPDYLSAYTSQNATDIARANAEAAQRSSLLGGLAGLGSSAILGGTGPNSALGGLYNLGSKGLEAIGNTSLWNSLFGTGPAITGDQDFLKSIGLDNSFYGSGTGGMLTDPLAGYDFNSNYDPSYLDNFYNLGG